MAIVALVDSGGYTRSIKEVGRVVNIEDCGDDGVQIHALTTGLVALVLPEGRTATVWLEETSQVQTGVSHIILGIGAAFRIDDTGKRWFVTVGAS